MTIEETIKAMENKQPVYYMGDRYDPIEIEPMFLSLEANHV